jgi:uncharacterized protein VirK/YbjX
LNVSIQRQGAESLGVRLGLLLAGSSSRAAERSRAAGLPWFASLRDRHDWRGSFHQRLGEAAKYLLRSACLPVLHSWYVDFVHRDPRMRAYRQRDPRLLQRHLHRFVNLHWSRRTRLLCLLAHYRFALAHLPAALFEAVYLRGGATLGTVVGKDGHPLQLRLLPPIDKGCEGELCLQLCDEHGRVLYRIVFSVIDEGATLAVGCLQGPDGEDRQERVRELTRALHGLRPKQLMLQLAYAFARHYGIGHLLAVSNAAHPLRGRGRRFRADYDAFWAEQQGCPDAGGWYELPARPEHKTEAEVPSRHRAAFRRRELLRCQAEQILAAALGEPAPRGRDAEAGRIAHPHCSPETAWTL